MRPDGTIPMVWCTSCNVVKTTTSTKGKSCVDGNHPHSTWYAPDDAKTILEEKRDGFVVQMSFVSGREAEKYRLLYYWFFLDGHVWKEQDKMPLGNEFSKIFFPAVSTTKTLVALEFKCSLNDITEVVYKSSMIRAKIRCQTCGHASAEDAVIDYDRIYRIRPGRAASAHFVSKCNICNRLNWIVMKDKLTIIYEQEYSRFYRRVLNMEAFGWLPFELIPEGRATIHTIRGKYGVSNSVLFNNGWAREENGNYHRVSAVTSQFRDVVKDLILH